ncbi:MAG: tripartite tricarboxylate transporter substrate binding protein [Pseudomonadota bacterium]
MWTGTRLTRRRALLSLGGMAAGLPGAARAQAWPARPVRVIVPFPPGAGADIVTRLVMAKLSILLGQPFFIDNRSGAAGNIGAAAVARAEPDGYTLLAAPSSIAVSQALYTNLPFDLQKDFTPVAMMASIPSLLVARPTLPVQSVAELVALAQRQPDTLTFASTGTGTAPHLVTASFMVQAGIQMRHIPYRGTPPAINDLLAGQVDLMFANLASVLPQVQAGKLKALGIASTRRNPGLPQLPTLIESGYPDFDFGTWVAVLAPKGTPAAAVERLNAAVQQVLQGQDLREQLREQGAEVREGSPEQTAAFIHAESARLARVIKTANIHLD